MCFNESSKRSRGRAAWLAGLVVLGASQGGTAQSLSGGLSLGAPVLPAAPVVTLNQDRLFAESLYGKRVARAIELAFSDLAAENQELKTALEIEEQRLTQARATLPAAEFRAQADAFDERVIRTRSEQDAKERNLQRQAERERQVFLKRVLPILAEIVAERGAVAILEERAVFLALDSVDITEEALRRVDATLGAGAPLEAEPLRDPSPPLRLPTPDAVGGTDTDGSDP